MAPNLKMGASAKAHAQLSNMHLAKGQFKVPYRGNSSTASTYIKKLLIVTNLAEWMKGICHIWSRGRHFSPSLPAGDVRYLKLSSQKRSAGRNLGGHGLVRRSGTTSRGTALLVLNLRMRSFRREGFLTIWVGQKYPIRTSKYTPVFSSKK